MGLNFTSGLSFSYSGKVEFTVNPKYQEILKLEKLLITAGIPHIKTKLFDGWKILYLGDNEGKYDVVEHFGSYGQEEDLLELIDCSGNVIGRVSAGAAFILWSEDYRKRNTSDYRIDRYMKAWKKIVHEKTLLNFPLSQQKLELLSACYRLAAYGCPSMDAGDLDYFDAASLIFTSVMAVVAGDTGFIKALLEYQTRKRFIGYILDMLIQCAIDNQKPEIQVMLVDYKYRNNLFNKKKFEL